MTEGIDDDPRAISPEMAVEQVELSAREYVAAHLVDVGERENSRVSIERRVDLCGRVMQITMHRTVWGKTGAGVLKVEWPANWWQHVKQRFAPRWALRRWPVLMETQAYDAMTYAPELVIRDPDAKGRRYATISTLHPSTETWT